MNQNNKNNKNNKGEICKKYFNCNKNIPKNTYKKGVPLLPGTRYENSVFINKTDSNKIIKEVLFKDEYKISKIMSELNYHGKRFTCDYYTYFECSKNISHAELIELRESLNKNLLIKNKFFNRIKLQNNINLIFQFQRSINDINNLIRLYTDLLEIPKEEYDIPDKKYIVMDRIEQNSNIQDITLYIDIIYDLYLITCDNGILLTDTNLYNIIIKPNNDVYLIDFGDAFIYDVGRGKESVPPEVRKSKKSILEKLSKNYLGPDFLYLRK